MSGSEIARWTRLCSEAKHLRHEGHLEDALKKYLEALQITPKHDKLQNIISKIESHLVDKRQPLVHLGDGFYLSQVVFDKLYDYQREGVLFLYRLFAMRKGGILGDDMGLGKTVQVCSFLSGMFDSKRIKKAIVVVPPALICNWESELTKWTPGLNIIKFHECTKRGKEKIIASMAFREGVCLTSYNMYTTSVQLLEHLEWDYCILDEGHRIKNHLSKTAKSLHTIKCPSRLILTGTPIMNNLKELWALYDWTHEGQLLGSSKTFSEKFEQPIVRARQKDASLNERRLGEAMSDQLNKLISPYMLRRLKENIKGKAGSGDLSMPKFTKKNDLVCWIRLSGDQEKVYTSFLTSPEVKMLLNSTRSPLVALTMLKKICDHPRLLSNKKCKMLGVSEGAAGLKEDSDDEDRVDVSVIPTSILIKEAGKMRFLFGLLDELTEEGHKCLVFSQSRKILDIIEKVLEERGVKCCRLDGRIVKMAERQKIIERFQTKAKYTIFLLTTKVGGVGLTLTAADRVIIYDPSWNPSTDAQAVDRAFRIGQTKDVVIYRLITCGTVEEKIYRRQVYKDSISKKILKDSKNPVRHFSKQDLFQLFELDNLEQSETQKQLAQMFQGKRNSDKDLESHIQFLHSLDNFTGISDHDLMFSRDDDDEVAEVASDGAEALQGGQYLEGYVSQAMERLNLESEENKALSQQIGRYVGGGVLESRQVSTKKQHTPEERVQRETKPRTPARKFAFVSSDEEDDQTDESVKVTRGRHGDDEGSDDGDEENRSPLREVSSHLNLSKGKNLSSSEDESSHVDGSTEEKVASGRRVEDGDDGSSRRNPLREVSNHLNLSKGKNLSSSEDEWTSHVEEKVASGRSDNGDDGDSCRNPQGEISDHSNSMRSLDLSSSEDESSHSGGPMEDKSVEASFKENRPVERESEARSGDSQSSYEDDVERSIVILDETYASTEVSKRSQMVVPDTEDEEGNYDREDSFVGKSLKRNAVMDDSSTTEQSFESDSPGPRPTNLGEPNESGQRHPLKSKNLEESLNSEGDPEPQDASERNVSSCSDSEHMSVDEDDDSSKDEDSVSVSDCSGRGNEASYVSRRSSHLHDYSAQAVDNTGLSGYGVEVSSRVSERENQDISSTSFDSKGVSFVGESTRVDSSIPGEGDVTELESDDSQEEEEGEDEASEINYSLQERYEDALNMGKKLCDERRFKEALDKFREAYKMFEGRQQDPIVAKMIHRLEGKLSGMNSSQAS